MTTQLEGLPKQLKCYRILSDLDSLRVPSLCMIKKAAFKGSTFIVGFKQGLFVALLLTLKGRLWQFKMLVHFVEQGFSSSPLALHNKKGRP